MVTNVSSAQTTDNPYNSMENEEIEQLIDHGNLVIRTIQANEENLINQVLTQFLGRRPDVEDYKKCTRFFQRDRSGEYELAYENTPLGTVKTSFQGITVNTSFNPSNPRHD